VWVFLRLNRAADLQVPLDEDDAAFYDDGAVLVR